MRKRRETDKYQVLVVHDVRDDDNVASAAYKWTFFFVNEPITRFSDLIY